MRTTIRDYNCQLLRSLITMKLNTLIRAVPQQGVAPPPSPGPVLDVAKLSSKQVKTV